MQVQRERKEKKVRDRSQYIYPHISFFHTRKNKHIRETDTLQDSRDPEKNKK